ncbi:MAG: hypothetical protein M0Z53_15500 [Thermaerobacter sp.]|nr:hypothetical protein [Thermaerobacter sp.]
MNVSSWVLFVVYALMSTAALLLMKSGLASPSFHLQTRPNFSLTLNYALVSGVALYVASFLTWLSIIRTASVVIAYPLSIGLIQLFLLGASYLLMHQRISVYTIIGAAFVLCGIALLSIAS